METTCCSNSELGHTRAVSYTHLDVYKRQLETLTRFEDDGTVSPWLAEDWSVADDQLTWTIKLKENVTFSNGEPMTATKVQEDVYKRQILYGGVWQQYYAKIRGKEKTDG